jgi:hypothetical protein
VAEELSRNKCTFSILRRVSKQEFRSKVNCETCVRVRVNYSPILSQCLSQTFCAPFQPTAFLGRQVRLQHRDHAVAADDACHARPIGSPD